MLEKKRDEGWGKGLIESIKRGVKSCVIVLRLI